jgi:hypothetical protein
MHPASFRCGLWAELVGTTDLPCFPEGDRRVYLVKFPDGVVDFWAVKATEYGYQFRDTADA